MDGNKNENMNKTKNLGTPKTICELKELIKNYPDETTFGFRNQPMQSLFEITDNGERFILFQ
jgi:hypothetical protein